MLGLCVVRGEEHCLLAQLLAGEVPQLGQVGVVAVALVGHVGAVLVLDLGRSNL